MADTHLMDTAPAHRNFLRAWLCSAALAGLCGSVAFGAEVNTSLQVSVVVAPRVSLDVQAPAELKISAMDALRGYVEVTDPTRLTLESNGPHGVMLELQAAGGLFTAMELVDADGTTRLPADGGVITVRWPTPTSQGKISLDWSWRFVLRPGVTAGSYAWPVRVAAHPLEPALAANRR